LVYGCAICSGGRVGIGVFTLVGQYLERRSKRKELLFTTAFDLAKEKTDFLVSYSKDTQNTASIHDYVAYAEQYYWLAKHLHDDGCLPKNWRDEVAKRFPMSPSE
jgi:hypothetical protein